ncbi:MAG: hypothetical protein ACKOTZ_10275 [Chloroflexota bacterium]
MTHTRAGRALLAAAWASAGILAGHVLTYDLLFPDAHHRETLLAATGHGWTEALPAALLVALLAALVAGLAGSGSGLGARGVRFGVLAVVQVGVFVAVEISERVLAAGSARILLHEVAAHQLVVILLVGIAIQVACAWLGSAASRVVARVAARRPRPVHPAAAHRTAPLPAAPLRRVARRARALPIRGPPIPVLHPPA